MNEWDSICYIGDIHLHSRSWLGLGRSGFVYSFIPVWELCRILFKIPVLERYHVVILANLVFSSLIISFVYVITKRITRNKLIALAGSIILIFSKDLILLAGNTFSEPMMILMILLSYLYYLTAIEKKSLSCFYLSAFIFGFAFEIKEAALLSILFFPAILLTSRGAGYFKFKNHLLFFLIFLLVGFIMPVYFYLKEGPSYIKHVLDVASISKFNLTNWPQVCSIMRHGFGILLFPLAGLILLLLRKRFATLLIIFTLLTPNIIFSIFGTRDNRYFVFGYIAFSILTAYCLFYAVQYATLVLKAPYKYASIYFIILLTALLSFNLTCFYRPLMADNEYSKHLKNYGLQLLTSFPENTVFILGESSAVMGRYYLPLTSSNKKIIWSGAEWPHRELNKMVTQYLSQGKRIIIDMDGFQGRWQYEKPDVIKLMSLYKCKDIGNHLIELTNESPAR